MTPSAFHVPPRPPSDRSQGLRGAAAEVEPLQRARRRRSRWTGCRATRRDSVAPSVPASGCAVVVASDRSHRRDAPSPEATKTICRPSGESANDAGWSVAGVTISTRVSGGAGGGVSRRCRTAGMASATAASAATANAPSTPAVRVAPMTATRRLRRRSSRTRPPAPGARRRCRATRCFGSFCRHARSSLADARRDVGGQRVQSGSRSSTRASVSETSSPAKGRVAREHLVQHAAERPDVGALVDRLPARLLRAHVRGRAENQRRPRVIAGVVIVGDCEHARRRRAVGSSAFASPKSSTFTVPSGRTLMLAGFRSRWMMPCSCAASSASAICLRDRQRLVERESAPLRDALGERRPFDQLHHERRRAAAASSRP